MVKEKEVKAEVSEQRSESLKERMERAVRERNEDLMRRFGSLYKNQDKKS